VAGRGWFVTDEGSRRRLGWRAWPGGLWQVSNEKEKEEPCFRDTRISESEQARSKKERKRERMRKSREEKRERERERKRERKRKSENERI